MITNCSPKAEIRWAMAGSAGREVFVVSIEEFLACGVSSHSETEFRGLLYKNMGRVEDTRRRKPRALTVAAGVSR